MGYNVGLGGMLFLVWLVVIIAFAVIRIAIFVVCVFAVYVAMRWVIDWIRRYRNRPIQEPYAPRHKRPHRSDDGTLNESEIDYPSTKDFVDREVSS